MTPTTTVTSLIATLRERGYRAELFPSDPPHTKVDAAMIWYEPHDLATKRHGVGSLRKRWVGVGPQLRAPGSRRHSSQ